MQPLTRLAHPTFSRRMLRDQDTAAIVLPRRHVRRCSHRFTWLTLRIGLFVFVIFVIFVVVIVVEIVIIEFAFVLVLVRTFILLSTHSVSPIAGTIRNTLLSRRHACVTVSGIAKWQTLAMKEPLFVRNRILRVSQDALRTIWSMDRAMDPGARNTIENPARLADVKHTSSGCLCSLRFSVAERVSIAVNDILKVRIHETEWRKIQLGQV
jgi:hypothetical protein